MSLELILVIVILILLLSGGYTIHQRQRWGLIPGGILGVVVLIVLIALLFLVL